MSRGEKYSNVDRVLELFAENRLYQTIKKPVVALLVELILTTGATPIDIVGIKEEHIDRQNKTLTLHPQKKKKLPPTTHLLSNHAITTFFELKKPLSEYSIRRLQQLLKEEMINIGSKLATTRSLRSAYLSSIYSTPQAGKKHTQLTSVKERLILSSQDIDKLRNTNYSPRKKRIILTLLDTGIRISELLVLSQKHIQGQRLVISSDISYNKKKRTVPLPASLKKFVTKNPFLFSSKNTPLTQRRFEQICHEVAQELKIDKLNPSILRTTAIYYLSKELNQEQLLEQVGLGSSTLYTHGFLSSPQEHTTQEREEQEEVSGEEQEQEQGADEYMYHRSKLRDGGDTDE